MKLAFVCLSLALSVLAQADPEWTNSKSVVFLTDDTFEAAREKHPKMMVFFYAPWCGHCKSTKPDYTDASDEVQFVAAMAAVDCTQSKDTCSKFSVTGYPTIKWFDSSDAAGVDYDGGRSSGAFITFIQKQTGDVKESFEGVDFSKMKMRQLKKILKDRAIECKGCTDKSEFVEAVETNYMRDKKTATKKKKPKGKSTKVNGMTFAEERRYKAAKKIADEGWEENGAVRHVVDFDFEKTREEVGKAFVIFYAPWCGHCKTLKPEFAKASVTLTGEASLLAIDCDSNAETCRKYKATSYPTLLWFPDSKSKGESFGGGRNEKGLVKWIRKKLNPTDVPEVFENEPAWEGDSGAVVFMTGEHWEQYRQEQAKLFVMFYAPWCGHCKAMKPAMGEASTALAGKMPIVAVDCTEQADLCGKFGVKGYPSIKYFSSSTGKGEDYNGGRTAKDIVAFCEKNAGSPEIKDEL